MIEINNKKLCESCFYETEEAVCPNCGYSKEKYTADPVFLPVGTRLNDNIIIGRVMGRGGFGITYLSYDISMKKTVAVKEYYPKEIAFRSHSGTNMLIADAGAEDVFKKGAEKFYSEAEVATQFNGNPNIVSVYDHFRENNTVYLIMEYLDGITLKKYVRGHGRISDGQALFIMDKAAAALSIIHSAGVLHRDISPDNIMICMDGRIKLIDFGAARQIMSESSEDLTVLLKPGYTPIEQYTKKGRQGAWTDIYSLGASVYYALTEVVIDDPYERIEKDNEFSVNKYGINNILWEIIRKCTRVTASERYGSAVDLRKALSSVSAPLKAEPVILSADDLKKTDEPDNEDQKKAPDINAAKNKKPETISRFETGGGSIVREEKGEDGAPMLRMKEDVYIPSKKDGKDKRMILTGRIFKNKKTAAAICAAIILVAAIVIAAGVLNRPEDIAADVHNNIENTSAADEEVYTSVDDTVAETEADVTEKNNVPESLVIPMDGEYPGDWNRISSFIGKDDLSSFNSDVKITLDASVDCTNEQIGYFNLRPVNSGGDLVPISEISGMANNINDEFEWYSMGTNIDTVKVSFVVSREDIEALDSEGLSFMVVNMTVNSAMLEDASKASDPQATENSDGSITVKMNDEYYGSSGWGSAGIFPNVLDRFKGDVKITLSVREYKDKASESLNGIGYSHDLCIDNHYSSDSIDISAENIGGKAAFYGTRVVLGKDVNEFVFIVSRDQIEKAGQCLGFRAANLIIESARIENYIPQEDSISADARNVTISMTDVGYGMQGYIPKNDLEFAEGKDVSITFDIEGKETTNGINTMDLNFSIRNRNVPVKAQNTGFAWYADVYSL
ncbi:MAG: serine/threonine protein kinase, partial [Oscillospiraceae bacterium]|nr:serine/threonine protein kinase [Oscillospiraceae bacterium]